MGEDLYELLGVPATASSAEITRAYRRLARALHPDAHPDEPAAADRFARVSAAYRVLIDPRQRAAYDRLRTAAGETTGAPLAGQRIPVTHLDGQDADALFTATPFTSGPFGTSHFFDPVAWTVTQRPGSPPPPRRGRDISGELTLDPDHAITGTTVTVKPTSPEKPPQHVRIPPGVRDGQRLRIPGAGHPGSGGGPPGDLYLTVRVRTHSRSDRPGNEEKL